MQRPEKRDSEKHWEDNRSWDHGKDWGAKGWSSSWSGGSAESSTKDADASQSAEPKARSVYNFKDIKQMQDEKAQAARQAPPAKWGQQADEQQAPTKAPPSKWGQQADG